jgi:cytochrome P450
MGRCMSTDDVRKLAPGIRQLLPLPYGAVARSRRDPIGFLMQGREQYGDVFRYRIGPLLFHVVSHPDHIRRVLLDNQKNYPRSWYYDRTKIVVGEGLVTTEGTAWRRLRRMVQPSFHHQRVAALAQVMTDSTEAMLKRWQGYATSGQTVDVSVEFVALTLQIVGKTLMNIDFSGETDRIGPAVSTMLGYLEYRINSLIPMPVAVPTPRNLRFRRALRTLDEIIYAVIARRRSTPDPEARDLLSILMSTRDPESGEALSDRELRDQIITFIGAGHETTAVALAWTCYLLSQHPEAEERLHTEVAEALAGKVPGADDLARLSYTRRVIEESLRLYPPVYATVRDALQDDEIGGYNVPARSMVVLCPYVTHRHPEFWNDPDRFDPDRFLPENSADRPRFVWYPFLGGPHQCIGQEFAMMEATLIVAMIAQRFRLKLAPDAKVEPHPMISLRPKNGVPMTIHSC